MGGIGMSIRNHVIQHFLVHCIPGNACKQEGFAIDLVFGEGIGMTGKASFATAQSANPVLCLLKGSRLGSVLFSPDIMRVRKFGHGVECDNLKGSLFVVVRNEEGQAWEVSSGCERGESAEQKAAGVTSVEPHRGRSIVLCFTGVDLSVCGRGFDKLVGGFVTLVSD